MSEVKLRSLEYRIKRARLWLGEIDVKVSPDLRVAEDTGAPYLNCSFTCRGVLVRIRLPFGRMTNVIIREIDTNLKGMITGTIDPDDVRAILLGFAPLTILAENWKLRSALRRCIALVKDQGLRKFLIYRRIKATKLAKSRGIPVKPEEA